MPTPPNVLKKIQLCRELGDDFLNLSSLELSEIPTEVFALSQLKSLSLNYNHITEIPDGIVQLTALEYLGLESNNIVSLSPTVAIFLKNVKTVALNFNEKQENTVDEGNPDSIGKESPTWKTGVAADIENANLAAALDLLEKHFPDNSDLLMLKFRFKTNEADFTTKSIIAADEYARNRNQIVAALLDFMQQSD